MIRIDHFDALVLLNADNRIVHVSITVKVDLKISVGEWCNPDWIVVGESRGITLPPTNDYP